MLTTRTTNPTSEKKGQSQLRRHLNEVSFFRTAPAQATCKQPQSVRPRTSARQNTGGRTPNGGCNLGSKPCPCVQPMVHAPDQFNYGLDRHGAYP